MPHYNDAHQRPSSCLRRHRFTSLLSREEDDFTNVSILGEQSGIEDAIRNLAYCAEN